MNTPILLGLNIDHCATVRQARYREFARDCGEMVEPDPVTFALLAEQAGADGITVHLREDRRHIQDSDVRRLRESIQTRLNLEMSASGDMLGVALELQPDSVCIVPEDRSEVTTEGGLDVIKYRDSLSELIPQLQKKGILVSLFIDPEPRQVTTSVELKAEMVELHTGSFANACYVPKAKKEELERLIHEAEHAHELGLTVNLGHGINYVNIADIRNVPHVHEMNIGHSIVSRALFSGVGEAVRFMKASKNWGRA